MMGNLRLYMMQIVLIFDVWQIGSTLAYKLCSF